MSQIAIQKKESFEENSNCFLEENLTINFSLSQCEKDNFYKIVIINQNSSLGEFPSFETEKIYCEKQNEEIEFSKKLKCKFYFNKRQAFLIRIRKGFLIDSTIFYKNYDRITILSSLITSPNSIYERNLIENEPSSEKIIIKLNKDIEYNETIFNWFKKGKKLSCYISLDFSNCHYNNYSDSKDNFIEIIERISNIVFSYTEKHTIYVYGIGGRIDLGDLYQTPFNINMNEYDASINSYKKIIENYDKCLDKIQPYDNIFLSPLIKRVKDEIDKSDNGKLYNILFILIKEIINKKDINMFTDAIIESSYLPLTIIIIDVGTDNFEYMNDIFKSLPSISNKGVKKYRNNILYYSLYVNFEDNIENMFNACLKEISRQIIEFDNLEAKNRNILGSSNIFDNIELSISPFAQNINKNFNSILKESKIKNEESNIISVNNTINKNNKKEIKYNENNSIIQNSISNNKYSEKDNEPNKKLNKQYTFQMPKLYNRDENNENYEKEDEKEINIIMKTQTSLIKSKIQNMDNPYQQDYLKKISGIVGNNNNKNGIKMNNVKEGISEYASTTYSELNKESNIISINNFPI